MIEIIIRGEPIPWSRAGKNGKISFTPARQKEAMRDIRHYAALQMTNEPLLVGPLRLKLVFTYSWPQSISKKARKTVAGRYKRTRPDVDNLIKIVADSLNGIVWNDDSQVACIEAIKVYGPIPSISILVSEIASEQSVPHLSVVKT